MEENENHNSFISFVPEDSLPHVTLQMIDSLNSSEIYERPYDALTKKTPRIEDDKQRMEMVKTWAHVISMMGL